MTHFRLIPNVKYRSNGAAKVQQSGAGKSLEFAQCLICLIFVSWNVQHCGYIDKVNTVDAT